MTGPPLDFTLLDDDDPFELDGGNLPHLFKHGPYSDEYLWEVWTSDPLFFEPTDQSRSADWLMVAEVAGDILVVPLAKPKSGNIRKARPIGLDIARDSELARRYLEER